MKDSIDRMKTLMNQASDDGCKTVVFPELALTSFFPYFYFEDKKTLDRFFIKEPIEKSIAAPLFDEAKRLGINFAFGYAEKTSNNCHFNTMVLFDYKTEAIYQYHKTHIPGFAKPNKGEVSFQFEKGIFESSEEGYPVFNMQGGRYGMIICHDRRYSNPFLAMGMGTGRNVEMVLNGYNTPFSLTFAQKDNEKLDSKVYDFHYLPQQAQAITEGTYVVSVAIAGNVFGVKQIGGTCIIAPDGNILQKQENLKEGIITANIDLDFACSVRQQKYDGDRANINVLIKDLIRVSGVNKAEQLISEVKAERKDKNIKPKPRKEILVPLTTSHISLITKQRNR